MEFRIHISLYRLIQYIKVCIYQHNFLAASCVFVFLCVFVFFFVLIVSHTDLRMICKVVQWSRFLVHTNGWSSGLLYKGVPRGPLNLNIRNQSHQTMQYASKSVSGSDRRGKIMFKHAISALADVWLNANLSDTNNFCRTCY